ncbi:hypothetical protein GCM10027073_48600 [Streptomyces chlorus]
MGEWAAEDHRARRTRADSVPHAPGPRTRRRPPRTGPAPPRGRGPAGSDPHRARPGRGGPTAPARPPDIEDPPHRTTEEGRHP